LTNRCTRDGPPQKTSRGRYFRRLHIKLAFSCLANAASAMDGRVIHQSFRLKATSLPTANPTKTSSNPPFFVSHSWSESTFPGQECRSSREDALGRADDSDGQEGCGGNHFSLNLAGVAPFARKLRKLNESCRLANRTPASSVTKGQ